MGQITLKSEVGISICCRHSQIPAGSSPVGFECNSTHHLPSSQVWPSVSTASETTLVVCSWTHPIPNNIALLVFRCRQCKH